MISNKSNVLKIFNRYIRNIVLNQALTIESAYKNEPILEYNKNSDEYSELKKVLTKLSECCIDVPIVIGDKELKTDDVQYQCMPHNHQCRIAKFHHANCEQITEAISVARNAQEKWSKVSAKEKYKIWQCAADLMATKYRQELNAATMLGQGKTVYQAEIDASCELIDFMRFNSDALVNWLPSYLPISTDPNTTLNSQRYRPLDGFVAAISPFNFTAIGGNLAYTPPLLGNTVLWKPSDTAMLSNWFIFQIMREAGLPPGVVNFVPCIGEIFGSQITSSPYLAGINFTGSAKTFKKIWSLVGSNIDIYKCFPRTIGECGGKNFHFIHSSADINSVVAGTLRAAFEYSGQKCSACSRMYVPESIWPLIKECLLKEVVKLKVGDVTDFSVFTSAVIDKSAFKRISTVIDEAKQRKCLEIIHGGTYSDKIGYFIDLTIIVTTDPCDKIMTEEIFGPIIAIYVYKDSNLKETMDLLVNSTDYALTGAIFAQDKEFLCEAMETFKMAAGNLYINDKSTGAVVGQQPFGGARLSGTNDKAGSPHYLLRWASPQNIKETFVPIHEIGYPYMNE